MGRLIDADELRKRLVEGVWNDAVKEVDDMPTVDAVPVVHGRWIKRHNEKKCSRCEFTYYSNNDYWFYCPKCGAKMDGKENK